METLLDDGKRSSTYFPLPATNEAMQSFRRIGVRKIYELPGQGTGEL